MRPEAQTGCHDGLARRAVPRPPDCQAAARGMMLWVIALWCLAMGFWLGVAWQANRASKALRTAAAERQARLHGGWQYVGGVRIPKFPPPPEQVRSGGSV